MPIELLLLLGAGGHAKVVYDALRSRNEHISIKVADSNSQLAGQQFFDIKVMPFEGWRNERIRDFHLCIGNCNARKKLATEAARFSTRYRTIIHSAAVVSPLANVGDGVLVAANAVVAPASRIGHGVIVNHAAVVDHDCWLGEFSHIAPNVTLGGGVSIGEGCLIGAGAVVLPGVNVGNGAVVGAGAVVTEDVDARCRVVGVPAKEIHS